jgi:general secretion pathway protein K
MRADYRQSATSVRRPPGGSKFDSGAASVDKSLSVVDSRRKEEKGVILIALLWILTALAVIALSFSRESFVEVAAARNTQSLEDAYFVARAGNNIAIYRLIQRRRIPPVRRAGIQGVQDSLDLGFVTGDLGGGAYRVDIQDESGKINLNTVPEQQLRALVEATGINKEDSDIITDSILDWRDADKMHHLNGAEDDYYEALNPPYKAKNGSFDTTEELLLVRGVTPTYFYGYPERAPDGSIVYKYGLSRCFTVYSNRNQISNRSQINVNFAPLPVLLSIPGMPPDAAQMIYDRRQKQPFSSTADITREIPINLGANTMPFLSTTQTGIYTLTAFAHAARSKARRVIRSVISLERTSQNTPYQTLYWNENVPDYESIQP